MTDFRVDGIFSSFGKLTSGLVMFVDSCRWRVRLRSLAGVCLRLGKDVRPLNVTTFLSLTCINGEVSISLAYQRH